MDAKKCCACACPLPSGQRATLSRSQRLTQRAAFQNAFATGRKAVGKRVIFFADSTPDSNRRLGVVAGRKTFRRAVDRNRARRLLREAYRNVRFRLKDAFDVVLVARHDVLDASADTLRAELLQLAERLKLLADTRQDREKEGSAST